MVFGKRCWAGMVALRLWEPGSAVSTWRQASLVVRSWFLVVKRLDKG